MARECPILQSLVQTWNQADGNKDDPSSRRGTEMLLICHCETTKSVNWCSCMKRQSGGNSSLGVARSVIKQYQDVHRIDASKKR